MNQPEEIEVESQNSPCVGQRLQQAREALKLSVDEVAERMRIGSSKVAALESGTIDGVGAPVFAAGYIRAYARIVDLPADELIAGFAGLEQLNEGGVSSVEEHIPAKFGRLDNELPANFSLASSRRWWSKLRWLILVLLLSIIAVTAYWLFKSSTMMSPESVVEHTESMSLPDQSSSQDNSSGSQSLAIPGQSTVEAHNDEDVGNLSLPLQSDIEEQPSAIAQANLVGEPVTDADQLNELILQFKDDSWVEVHDARKQRLIHQLARAGQTHTLQGAAPFSLVLGYVPGVAISLNGEAVDLSRYQGRRLVHLTIGEDALHAN